MRFREQLTVCRYECREHNQLLFLYCPALERNLSDCLGQTSQNRTSGQRSAPASGVVGVQLADEPDSDRTRRSFPIQAQRRRMLRLLPTGGTLPTGPLGTPRETARTGSAVPSEV